MQKSASSNQFSSSEPGAGPSAPWLAAGFLLTGLGTVLLGPILPTLAHNWHLSDQQSGILFAAKFVGAFCGGATVPRRVRFGILAGMVLAFFGFGAFALAPGLATGAAALFVSGLGLGQIIASTNILAGLRYRTHTGSALSSLNFFWALGAVMTGLLAGAVLPHFTLRGPLLIFAGLFLATGIGGALGTSRTKPAPAAEPVKEPATRPLARALFLQFALLLFLYGGLETCLTGWLTMFAQRFSDTRLLGGQSAQVLLWTALTAGRLVASALLRWMKESTVQRAGLAFSALLIALLASADRGPVISLLCLLLGLSLAPFFPSTFALLMHRRPSSRVAGFILAVSGLGAALFPWLMGLVSTRFGSLRIAMFVPFALALTLLGLSFLRTSKDTAITAAA